jgi:hypothetical protein
MPRAPHPTMPRTLRLTPDHVARATRPVPDTPYPSTFTRATDADYAALATGFWRSARPAPSGSSPTAP